MLKRSEIHYPSQITLLQVRLSSTEDLFLIRSGRCTDRDLIIPTRGKCQKIPRLRFRIQALLNILMILLCNQRVQILIFYLTLKTY